MVSKSGPLQQRLEGINKETCYCLIANHHSGMLHGKYFTSKALPIKFLNAWLSKYSPPAKVQGKYARFDAGGDLGKCHNVLDAFTNSGYNIELTAPGHFHQNGPMERLHRTIGEAMHTMLHGANLPNKFWHYPFHYNLCIANSVPHLGHDSSPLEHTTGNMHDLSYLHTFGY